MARVHKGASHGQALACGGSTLCTEAQPFARSASAHGRTMAQNAPLRMYRVSGGKAQRSKPTVIVDSSGKKQSVSAELAAIFRRRRTSLRVASDPSDPVSTTESDSDSDSNSDSPFD